MSFRPRPDIELDPRSSARVARRLRTTCDRCGEEHIDRTQAPWRCTREPAGHSRCCVGCPNRESDDSMRLRTALEVMGQAIRDRYRCLRGPLACGGVCCLTLGHEPPCLCNGDEEGVPGSCQA